MLKDKIILNVSEAVKKVLNQESRIDDLKDNKKIRQDTDWYHDKNDRQEKKKSEPNIKTFTGKYGKSNYKSMSENVSEIDEQKDVKHEEMNEGWGAREQQHRRDVQNKAWDDLLDKHKGHPENSEKLKNLRLKNWSAVAAEKQLKEDVSNKIYDPITKKYVKRKPLTAKMGGGWRKTIDGVVVDSSDKKEIGKKFSESLSIFSEKGLKGLFEAIYNISDETEEIINETSEFVGIPQSINTIRKTKEHLKVNTNLPKSIRKELEQKIEDHRKHLERSGFDFKEDLDDIDWDTLLEEPDSDEFVKELETAKKKANGEIKNKDIAKGLEISVRNEELMDDIQSLDEAINAHTLLSQAHDNHTRLLNRAIENDDDAAAKTHRKYLENIGGKLKKVKKQYDVLKQAHDNHTRLKQKAIENDDVNVIKSHDSFLNKINKKIKKVALHNEEIEDLDESVKLYTAIIKHTTTGNTRKQHFATSRSPKFQAKQYLNAREYVHDITHYKNLQDFKQKNINEDVEDLDESLQLNKVNHVYHDANAKKFADEYVKGHSGDYREGGPTRQDLEHGENFHANYATKHARSGFAGGGKKVFTHNTTGEKFEVEIEPNGKTFYGNDHRIRKINENLEESQMTDVEMKNREKIVKGMKKNLTSFKDRYGDRAKDVMYAVATKNAMKE